MCILGFLVIAKDIKFMIWKPKLFLCLEMLFGMNTYFLLPKIFLYIDSPNLSVSKPKSVEASTLSNPPLSISTRSNRLTQTSLVE